MWTIPPKSEHDKKKTVAEMEREVMQEMRTQALAVVQDTVAILEVVLVATVAVGVVVHSVVVRVDVEVPGGEEDGEEEEEVVVVIRYV